MRSTIRDLMPGSLKTAWWYCTDAEWRQSYRSTRKRIGALQGAQRRAFSRQPASGVGDALLRRFRATHDVEVIATTCRTGADLPPGIVLSEEMALAAMEESRGEQMAWHWMRAR